MTLAETSPGEIATIIGVVVFLLGLLAGGAWWLSALFSNVVSNGTETRRNYKLL